MFEPLLEDDDEVLKYTAVGVYKVFLFPFHVVFESIAYK